MNSTRSSGEVKQGEKMQNLTVRERAILVAAMLVFLVGAGHRYWKAKVSTVSSLQQTNDAKN
jgi:hypothetical protein